MPEHDVTSSGQTKKLRRLNYHSHVLHYHTQIISFWETIFSLAMVVLWWSLDLFCIGIERIVSEIWKFVDICRHVCQLVHTLHGDVNQFSLHVINNYMYKYMYLQVEKIILRVIQDKASTVAASSSLPKRRRPSARVMAVSKRHSASFIARRSLARSSSIRCCRASCFCQS